MTGRCQRGGWAGPAAEGGADVPPWGSLLCLGGRMFGAEVLGELQLWQEPSGHSPGSLQLLGSGASRRWAQVCGVAWVTPQAGLDAAQRGWRELE